RRPRAVRPRPCSSRSLPSVSPLLGRTTVTRSEARAAGRGRTLWTAGRRLTGRAAVRRGRGRTGRSRAARTRAAGTARAAGRAAPRAARRRLVEGLRALVGDELLEVHPVVEGRGAVEPEVVAGAGPDGEAVLGLLEEEGDRVGAPALLRVGQGGDRVDGDTHVVVDAQVDPTRGVRRAALTGTPVAAAGTAGVGEGGRGGQAARSRPRARRRP